MVPNMGGTFQNHSILELRLNLQMVEGAVPVSYTVVANWLLHFSFDEQLEVLDIDIFAAFSMDWAFWGISFLDRKPGSDNRDRRSWMCLSLESSIAVIIDVLACSPRWCKNGRLRMSGWNIVAKVQHLGRFSHLLIYFVTFFWVLTRTFSLTGSTISMKQSEWFFHIQTLNSPRIGLSSKTLPGWDDFQV